MAQMPDPFPSLLARIKRIEDRLNQRLASSPFFGTGMHPTGDGGMQVDGAMTVGGELNVTGNTVIGGTLSLPAGIVDNDALANPLEPARVHTDAQNFAVPAASSGYSTIASVGITVPSGFTQMLVMSQNANATAYNSTASNDFLYVRGRINASDSGGFVLGSSSTAAGDYGVAVDFQTRLLSGLTPGSTVTFALQVQAAFAAWSVNSGNAANLDAALLWLR